jgi:hypothetical protein
MTDLRDRIAKVLASTFCTLAENNPCAECTESELPVADAVITELNLNKQFGCPVAGHHSCRCSHRYTTPWKDNE